MRKVLPAITLGLVSVLLVGCASTMGAFTSGDIEDDPGKRTMGETVEDESIETKALVNIRKADAALDDSHINVVSYAGYVLIIGQVPSQALKDRASEEVRQIRNVKRIYNELEIGGPSSAMTRTSDTWLTSKVKSKLVTRSDIEGGRVKVVTENGVVYLMGLATEEEAQRITDAASSVGGVQRVVRIFKIFEIDAGAGSGST